MRLRANKTTGWLGGVVLVLAAAAAGQSRNAQIISEPGSLNTIGGNTSVHRFQNYSYGLGSLNDAYSAPGNSVLRSSILDSSMSVRRGNPLAVSGSTPLTPLVEGSLGVSRPMAPPMAGLDLRVGDGGLDRSPLLVSPIAPLAPEGGRLLKGQGLLAGTVAEVPDDGVGALVERNATALGAAQEYLRALEAASASQLRTQKEPITTLVPTTASLYRDRMALGDLAFRANNFLEAASQFQIANDVGDRDPESLICLVHTQFALSSYSYAKAAYYLELALKYMPELPLANIRPRGFYGTSAKYAEHLVALEEHIETSPYDPEAMLLLAYYRWFGQAQDVKAAHDALSRGLAVALRRKDTPLVEAIETFWDGMVAAGKVSGTIRPAALEGPATTQPAAGSTGIPAAIAPVGPAPAGP